MTSGGTAISGILFLLCSGILFLQCSGILNFRFIDIGLNDLWSKDPGSTVIR